MEEALIRLYPMNALVITTDEYERIKRDVEARIIAGCAELGDSILARLLLDHEWRYREAKAINASRTK